MITDTEGTKIMDTTEATIVVAAEPTDVTVCDDRGTVRGWSVLAGRSDGDGTVARFSVIPPEGGDPSWAGGLAEFADGIVDDWHDLVERFRGPVTSFVWGVEVS